MYTTRNASIWPVRYFAGILTHHTGWISGILLNPLNWYFKTLVSNTGRKCRLEIKHIIIARNQTNSSPSVHHAETGKGWRCFNITVIYFPFPMCKIVAQNLSRKCYHIFLCKTSAQRQMTNIKSQCILYKMSLVRAGQVLLCHIIPIKFSHSLSKWNIQ